MPKTAHFGLKIALIQGQQEGGGVQVDGLESKAAMPMPERDILV